ncbi:MAG: NADH-quinone oxidoreductase subunit N [Phenylobacterium sp.]|jgi:NADH-quinone oxidoreductase subunit N
MSLHYLPAIVLTVTTLILLLVIALKRKHALAYLICGAGLLFTMLTLFMQIGKPGTSTELFLFDPITPFISLILLIVVCMLWVQLHQWLETLDERKEEYYLLLLLTTLGALIMIASNHFASFFLGLELMSLSLVGLVAYSGHDLKAQEAGVKYLILSAIASALILMGIAILYLQFGTLGFSDLAQATQLAVLPGWVTSTAIVFILGGLFFKLSLVPCHLWVADLFEGAPLPTAALLATVSKLSAFIILWRIFNTGQWHSYEVVADIVAVVAIASMLVGNFLGLLQNNLLRLMAYSSIAHFGYLLIILLLVDTPKTLFISSSFATEATIFYLVAYLFTLIGVFSVLIQLPQIKTQQDLTGLFWHKPSIAITLALLMLSLAGIPLTIGFMGKFYLVVTAVSHQMWWLLSALVIGSVIGLFYYLRVIMQMIKQPEEVSGGIDGDNGTNDFSDLNISANGQLLNFLIIFLVIGFGTFPGAFSQLIAQLSR